MKKVLSLLVVLCMLAALCACVPDEDNKDGPMYFSGNKHLPFSVTLPDGSVTVAELNALDFGADDTGKRDSSSALQKAVNYCKSEKGGGTVYIPSGKYLVTEQIRLLSGVSLIGNDALIIVSTEDRFEDSRSVINMQSSTCIDSLSFFYPSQNVCSPIPYYYTIDGEGDSRTVRNITLVNSYCGISTSSKDDCSFVEYKNIRGTVLKRGIYSYHDTDSCSYSEIEFSPDVWAGFSDEYVCPSCDDILKTARSLQSVGLYLVNIDRSTFNGITVKGCKYGIYNEAPDLTSLSGSFNNIKISDAEYGMYVTGVSSVSGISVADSDIHGDTYDVMNASPNQGCVNLYNTETIMTAGNVRHLSSKPYSTGKAVESRDGAVSPRRKVFNVADYGADDTAKRDSTEAFQRALDAAHRNNGGRVYVPHGKYRIDGGLNVYAGTSVYGCAPYMQSDPRYSSVIYARSKERSLFNILGNGCQLAGIYVVYPENGIENKSSFARTDDHPYTVNVVADGFVMSYTTVVAASHGVNLKKSDGSRINGVLLAVYKNGIKISSSDNVTLENVHTAPSLAARLCDYDTPFESWMNEDTTYAGKELSWVSAVVDNHARKDLVFITADNCRGCEVSDCSHYGALTFAALDTVGMKFKNIAASRLNADKGKVFALTGGSAIYAVNVSAYGSDAGAMTFEKGCGGVIAPLTEAGHQAKIVKIK